jgi:hypothetical protein
LALGEVELHVFGNLRVCVSGIQSDDAHSGGIRERHAFHALGDNPMLLDQLVTD